MEKNSAVKMKKASRSIRKKRSFWSLLLLRMAILLVVMVAIAGTVYWMIRKDVFTSNDAREMFAQDASKTFANKAAYEEGGTKYIPLPGGSGKEQWLAAIRDADRVMPIALGEDGYWGVFDYKNDAILAEYSDQCFMVGLTFQSNEEKPSEYGYVLAEEQMDVFMPLMKTTGAERLTSNVYISAGYVKGNRCMIEKYRIGIDGQDVTVPCGDTSQWNHFTLNIVNTEELDDKNYDHAIYWNGVHKMYGSMDKYEIASTGCLINASSYAKVSEGEETPISGKIDEKIKKEAKKRVDECVQQYWGDKQNITYEEGHVQMGTEHVGTLASDRIWIVEAFGDGENIYGFVYTANWENTELWGIFWKLMLAAVFIALVGAILWANISYTKYKLQREVFEYRTMVTNTMAHDLKSPLMAISGYVENILENTNPEKNNHYLKEIAKKTTYMNHLIENTLELAKSEELVVEKTSQLDVREGVLEILDEFSDTIASKELVVTVDGQKQIACDANAMRVALRNIVENAVKYTPQQGKLQVLLQDGAIVVKNTSPKVATEGNKLFEAFVKDDASRSGAKGNGLGLAIVRTICEAHGFETRAEYKDGMFILSIGV